MADENVIQGSPSDQPDDLAVRVQELELARIELHSHLMAIEWALLEIAQSLQITVQPHGLKAEIDRRAEEKFQEWLGGLSNTDPRGAAGLTQLRERIARLRDAKS
jgi:hypothetical protein